MRFDVEEKELGHGNYDLSASWKAGLTWNTVRSD